VTIWLEDKDAIRELLAEYCFHLDGYRLGELAGLFGDDGEWNSRYGQATGREAIERLLLSIVPTPRIGQRRKHFTTNIISDSTAIALKSSPIFWWCGTAEPARSSRLPGLTTISWCASVGHGSLDRGVCRMISPEKVV
jgi:hypothetical protein